MAIGSGENEAREALLHAEVDGVIFDCGPRGDTLTLILKDRGYGVCLSAEGRIAIKLVTVTPRRETSVMSRAEVLWMLVQSLEADEHLSVERLSDGRVSARRVEPTTPQGE